MTPYQSWSSVEQRLASTSEVGMQALLRARWCQAATLAHAIGRLPHDMLPSAHDRRWRLWIVGARESLEGELARSGLLLEVFTALVPAPAGWELTLIGPEMAETSELRVSGRHVLRSMRGTMHGLLEAGLLDARGPDLAALFNSGMGTLCWPLVEPWLPTAARLLAFDVPLLLTCFHDGESDGEQSLLVSGPFMARVVCPPADNPCAHVIPTDALAWRPTAAEEAELAREVARCAEVADVAREQKRRRDEEAEAVAAKDGAAAAAAAAGRGGMGGASEAGRLYSKLNDVGAIETANGRCCWLRGSALSTERLVGDAVRAARRWLRDLCAAFAVARMPQWLGGLMRSRSRDGARPAPLESTAVDAMQLAEALASSAALCARALDLGAPSLLGGALADACAAGYVGRGARRRKGAAAASGGKEEEEEEEEKEEEEKEEEEEGGEGDGSTSTSGDTSIRGDAQYTGMPAATRLGVACERSLRHLAAAAAAKAAIEALPAAPEQPLNEPTRFRVVFRGAYVHARAQPSTTAASVGQLPCGACFTGSALQGPWVRLGLGEELAGSWVLSKHPVHGMLLERVRNGEDG